MLRIEAGMPRFGAEIDEQVMPAEAGVVDRAVSFTKGCYIGQEPVARLHYRGHANRGLRSILLDGTAARGRRDGRGRGPRGRAHHVRRRVAHDRPGGGAGDRAARGRPRPAGRRGDGRTACSRASSPPSPRTGGAPEVLTALGAAAAIAAVWLVGHALLRGRLPAGLSSLEMHAARLVTGLGALSAAAVALADLGLHAPVVDGHRHGGADRDRARLQPGRTTTRRRGSRAPTWRSSPPRC